MKLGENIRNFRTFRQITQGQLAELVGKSKNTISNWERGDNFPDPDTIERLCEIFDVTPNQIFGWDKLPELEEFLRDQREKAETLARLRKKQDELKKEILQIEREITKQKMD